MNNIMNHLHYADYPSGKSYKNPAVRRYLRLASRCTCAYCTITERESPGATFHIDHFRPRSKFPNLEDECINLRYCCPICNLAKSDFWISEEDGCIRDCSICNEKLCQKDIFRLIDSYNEDPNSYFSLQSDNTVIANSGYKPAEHTIKQLRLNRKQLIRLRDTRKYLDLWKNEIQIYEAELLETMKVISLKKRTFIKYSRKVQLNNYDLIDTLFELLDTQLQFDIEILEHELEKVNVMIAFREFDMDDI